MSIVICWTVGSLCGHSVCCPSCVSSCMRRKSVLPSCVVVGCNGEVKSKTWELGRNHVPKHEKLRNVPSGNRVRWSGGQSVILLLLSRSVCHNTYRQLYIALLDSTLVGSPVTFFQHCALGLFDTNLSFGSHCSLFRTWSSGCFLNLMLV